MPITKKDEPLKERPLIIAIYGGPGLGKTSLANTARDPIILDFDRGIDRSYNRQDSLQPRDWEEVMALEAEGAFKPYKTRVIDTAKAALDDFLMTYVRKIDPKNRSNKLAAYGAIGDEFKVFVNNCRNEQSDLLIIAHAKEKEEGGLNMTIPDITGQSYQLVLRIADMVGFVYTRANKRMIRFDPTDETKGKNVAQFPETEIPDVSDPAYKTFISDLFDRVRKSLVEKSEAQLEAEKAQRELLELLASCQSVQDYDQLLIRVRTLPPHLSAPLESEIAGKASEFIAKCDTPENLTDLLVMVNKLAAMYGIPIKKAIAEYGQAKGWIVNKEAKRFELPEPGAGLAQAKQAETPGSNPGQNVPPSDTNGRDIETNGQKTGTSAGMVFTTVDERTRELEQAGARAEVDGFAYGKGFKSFMSYEQLASMPEDQFTKLLGDIAKAKPKAAAAK
jgi:hypothetical protein